MHKAYQVFYYTKHGRKQQEELNHMFISAQNAKEACKKCKQVVFEKTGRNAFRPTTKCPSSIK